MSIRIIVLSCVVTSKRALVSGLQQLEATNDLSLHEELELDSIGRVLLESHHVVFVLVEIRARREVENDVAVMVFRN